MSVQDKNTFHYRMSKKVAELTQVVHMLFARNHEKEIEMTAMKESYEYEIDLVIQDAKCRIAKLESTVAELMKQNLEYAERGQIERDVALGEKDAEWRQKLVEKDKSLQEERMESQNLRAMLINAQSDIESLKQNLARQNVSKNNEINRKNEEIDQILKRLAAADNRLNSTHINGQSTLDELQKTNEKLANDIIQLQALQDKSCKNNEQLLTRNKQLEADLKDAKVQYKKLSQASIKQNKDTKSLDMNEELDRLRQEVQRYRLELSNRDNNFTKMFCEKQPALVIHRSTEPQQEGLMSVVVPPGYTRSSSPYGFVRMNSSAPQTSSVTKERPSLLANWDNQRKSSISANIESENFDSETEKLHYEQIVNDYRRQSNKKNKTLINVKDSIHNKQEAALDQLNRTSKKLPLLCATSEPNQLTTQLNKPKTLTKPSLYVK